MIKDKKIDTRFTNEEKELILKYCKENKLKPSVFLRQCALNTIKENEMEKENK